MRPRPKFTVGEEVRIYSADHPSQTVECTEVLGMSYGELKGIEGDTWVYQTVAVGNGKYWIHEDFLQKLPPKHRISWEDCVFKPVDRKELT